MKSAPDYYLVGSVSCDITPPVGIRLAGFAAVSAPSTGVELPLRATLFYISDGTSSTLIVSAEWLGFYDLATPFRTRLSEATGIPLSAISLVGTHTHAGPCIREFDQTKGPLDGDYITRAQTTLVNAAKQAISQAELSYLYVAAVPFPLAISRRRPDGKGGVEWNPCTDGLSDPTLSVISVRSKETKRLTSVLFSYACHPTSRQVLEIGGDFVGFAYQQWDRLFPGIPIGFLQGCAGDQKPAFTDEGVKKFRPASSSELSKLGAQIATTLSACVEPDAAIPLSGPLRLQSHSIPLHLYEPPRAVYEHFCSSPLPAAQQWVKNHRWIGTDQPVETLQLEVQTLAFGRSLAIIFLAGEISVGYALRLREEWEKIFQAIIPLGYTNEIIGYVPTSAQIPEGGYESWYAQLHWNRPGLFRDEIEESILSAIRQSLRDALSLDNVFRPTSST